MGQEVDPTDVIARAGRPRHLLVVDLTKKLQVTATEANRLALKTPGEPIQQGEPVAERRSGWFGNRRIMSPVDGRVLDVTAGRMIIQPNPELYEMRAMMTGTVSSILLNIGAIIETPGAMIQGVWGSGKEGYGALKLGVSDPAETLKGTQLEIGFHGAILVCGATLDLELLERAQELQVRGLIVGAIPPELQSAVQRQILPVVATEGLGRIPIAASLFNLLKTNEGRETMLFANAGGRWTATRPEILIPLPASTQPELPPKPGIAPARGQRVRILREPYHGTIGIIKRLHNEPKILDNGARHAGADVTMDDGTVLFVPYVNLDFIGS